MRSIAEKFSGKLWPGLSRLRQNLSHEVEAGCRPVIAWFLAATVEQARIIFNDPRLAIHSEVKIPSVQIPNVGPVGGKLNFLVADVQGDGPIGNPDVGPVAYSNRHYCGEFDARNASIEKGQPSFIIVEAKRASALDDHDSEAELIGLLKSYMIRRYISLPRDHPVASSLIIAFPDVCALLNC